MGRAVLDRRTRSDGVLRLRRSRHCYGLLVPLKSCDKTLVRAGPNKAERGGDLRWRHMGHWPLGGVLLDPLQDAVLRRGAEGISCGSSDSKQGRLATHHVEVMAAFPRHCVGKGIRCRGSFCKRGRRPRNSQRLHSSPGYLHVGQVLSNWFWQIPQTSSSGKSQRQMATASHFLILTFIAGLQAACVRCVDVHVREVGRAGSPVSQPVIDGWPKLLQPVPLGRCWSCANRRRQSLSAQKGRQGKKKLAAPPAVVPDSSALLKESRPTPRSNSRATFAPLRPRTGHGLNSPLGCKVHRHSAGAQEPNK